MMRGSTAGISKMSQGKRCSPRGVNTPHGSPGPSRDFLGAGKQAPAVVPFELSVIPSVCFATRRGVIQTNDLYGLLQLQHMSASQARIGIQLRGNQLGGKGVSKQQGNSRLREKG